MAILMALQLLLLCAPLQSSAPAEPAAQITELGTVEFAAGPARGIARFYLVDGDPHVAVSIRNDLDRPIWWRPNMTESYSYGWIVEPVDLSGEVVPHDPGAVCMNIVGVPAWERILPGATGEPWTARPIQDAFEDNVQEVSPLDRWAWWHPFVLPRDSTAKGNRPGFGANIVLAWSRATGPRVFLDQQGSIFLDHFDPFADEPFQRGIGPIPFHCGPLRGTALLRHEKDWPVVEWTLTNPLDREVFWSLTGVGSPLTWGFTTVDFEAGKEIDHAYMYDAELHRAHGRFAPDPQCRFAPGETRTGRLAPYSFDPTGAEDHQVEFGPRLVQRWHYVLDSTWPCTREGEQPPRFLPTQLHFYWENDFGFDAALQEHESFRNGGAWKPYGQSNAAWSRSASFAFGDCDATFLMRSWNGRCEIHVHNTGAEPQHWIPIENQPFVWLRKPGAAESILPPRREPKPWPQQGAALSDRYASLVRLNAGESEFNSCYLDGESWLDPSEEKLDYAQPWDALIPVALPQARVPAHDFDAARGWLRVRWDPATGLDVRAHNSWPF